MKKLSYLLIAAFATLAVASCVKDQIEAVPQEGSVGQTEFTVALTPGTRTDLVEGKTVWREGDKLWVSNGAAVDTIVVPASADGQASFSFKTEKATPTATNPNVYVVYPATSGKKVADGIVTVDVPSVQNGMFESANICAGKAFLGAVELHNVTGVLKVNVPETVVEPVYQLVFSGADGAALSGTCTVDFTGIDPVVKAGTTASSVIVQAGGICDDFYAAVIPGTYAAGFKMTAATINFKHASETKVSTVANTVKINQIVDLGTIGTNLQSLSGDGTEASPWIIENMGHLIAVSTAVDNGEESETFAGKYFMLGSDIDGVSTPIGSVSKPFCGGFDGNGKTIKLSLSGANDLGLFATLSSGATIQNLVLEGSVVSSGDYVGALAGNVEVEEGAVSISNITNKAAVSGKKYVGGLVGWTYITPADGLEIKNCKNTGKITGTGNCVGGIAGQASQPDVASKNQKLVDCVNSGEVTGANNVGGVCGYAYKVAFSNCDNQNAVKGTEEKTSPMYGNEGWIASTGYNLGVGGVVGWAQNSSVTDCDNTGSVDGFIKVGGVIGSAYWTPSTNVSNTGNITAKGEYAYNISSQLGYGFGSVAGGVIGWLMTNGDVTQATNTGTVKGKGGIGGIIGIVIADKNNAGPVISNCQNSGAVVSSGVSFGGAEGLRWHNAATGGIVGSMMGNIEKAAKLQNCTNSGDVSSDRQNVGGIVGHVTRLGSYTAYNKIGNPQILQCVNKGNVTGLYWVGGIVGLSYARTMTKTTLKNCANHGAITATRSDDAGDYVGGLVGAVGTYSSSYKNNNNKHLTIYNSYNDGDVVYATATDTKPYAGGIIGNADGAFEFANTYNVGFIGPKSKEAPTAAALARLGEIAGTIYADKDSNSGIQLKFSYYPSFGSVKTLVGTGSATSSDPNIASFDSEGALSKAVVVNSKDCISLLEALNEWQNYYVSYSYYNWGGPAVHPVHTDTMD